MKALFVLLIVSFNAFAVDWNGLKIGNTYSVTQNFSLKQLERSGSMLEISKGEKAVLKEVSPLGSVPVTLYVFNYKNCPGPAITTDMEIIPVQGSNPVVEIGAQIESNCELQIFVETRDIISTSIFE